MPKMFQEQKGIASLFILLLLLSSVVLGVFLVQNPTNILPKASENKSDTKKFKQALKFNNENGNDQFLTMQPHYIPDLSPSEFTLETWVKIPKPINEDYIRDYSLLTVTKQPGYYDYGVLARLSFETQGSDGSSRPMFQALLKNWNDPRNSHLAFIHVGSNNYTGIPADTWSHIAVTSFSQGEKCTLRLFINGKLSDTSERFMKGGCSVDLRNPGEVLFAKNPPALSGISGYYFPGAIEEMRFSLGLRYSQDFTPSLDPFPLDSNTLALYRFNRDTKDSSNTGFGNSPTITGNEVFIDSDIDRQFKDPQKVKPSKSPKAQKGYYLEAWPMQGVLVEPGTDYAVSALLKDRKGEVVKDQSGFEYIWTQKSYGGSPTLTPFSGCTNGIKEPCPMDHATVTSPTEGYTNLFVSVKDKSNNLTVAEGRFFVTIQKNLVGINVLYPDGGEQFKIGQEIEIRWQLYNGLPDYYNVYYNYNDLGELKGGYIGTVKAPETSIKWTVPKELKNQSARVIVEANKNGTAGNDISDSLFTVK